MASAKSNGVDSSNWARAPNTSGPAWRRILTAIYNPEEKSFLGRTAKRWGIVLVFYLVFYSVLALLFALCMGGLLLTLDKKRPTYILEKSLIGSSPGLAYRPYPAAADGPRAIAEYKWRYHRNDTATQESFANRLEKFLSQHGFEQAECSRNDSFGLPDSPCFIIKLNYIIGWTPQFYEPTELPQDMPEDLQQYINTLPPERRKQVWISCADEKGNNTVIEYPWGRGLSGSITAVKIRPKENDSSIVRCRAWAKNIEYNGSSKDILAAGYTRIQIHIESDTHTDTAVAK